MNKNTLEIQLNESEIEKNTAIDLKNTFMPFFEEAEKWKNKAKDIVVTNIEQIEDIKLAREARLSLKSIRVDVEKTRKRLKEESLRKGKAIDGLANVIKYLITPIEEHLQKQEDFVKIQEEIKKTELMEKRIKELESYDIFDTSFYNLSEMPEESYLQLLHNSKLSFERRKEDERKLEEEKIAKEKAELEERDRIKKENEKLRNEAKERERLAEIERKKLEKEAIKREQAGEIERKKQEEILEEQRKIAEAEQKKREQLEFEIREKKELEEKKKLEAEEKVRKEKELQIKIEREKELEPDRKKLEQLAITITQIELPKLNDEKAKQVIKKVVNILNDASNLIKQECINL